MVCIILYYYRPIVYNNISYNNIREAVAMSNMNDLFVVQMLGVIITNKNIIIITEYCKGGELTDSFVKERLSNEQQWLISHQLCEGLINLHHKGIIHRDIKPENVLLDGDNNAKWADLGVAQQVIII